MNYKKTIISIAQDIINEKIDLIDGAREISKFGVGYGLENNKDMLFFVGLNSETDHLPIGKDRDNWNKEMLSGKDKESRQIKSFYHNLAIEACKGLIRGIEET